MRRDSVSRLAVANKVKQVSYQGFATGQNRVGIGLAQPVVEQAREARIHQVCGYLRINRQLLLFIGKGKVTQ